MTFAQPIRRPVSNASISPSWLTSGVNIGSSAFSSAGPSSGGSISGGGGGFAAFGSHIGSMGGSGSAGSGDSRRHEQDLINAYEAEEERIINVLSRKLEQLREDKIDLENALEAESESHVNRLLREMQALRQANGDLESQLAQANAQLKARAGSNTSQVSPPPPPPSRRGDNDDDMMVAAAVHEMNNLIRGSMHGQSLQEPSAALMLDAMQRENEALRNRLVDTERDYVRVSRLNEVYREELIQHRSRLGLSVDNLIGLTSSDRDPFSHPTHHRSRSSSRSASSSPSVPLVSGYGFSSGSVNGQRTHYPSSVASTSTHVPHLSHSHGVPIPRPPSQIHRPIRTHTNSTVGAATPLSTSPSSASGSSYPLSPIYSISGASSSDSYLVGDSGRRRSGSGASGATPASFVSVSTNLTSPPSSMPFGGMAMFGAGAFAVPQRGLSYPSVPPPSLSSSFGSPTVSFHMPHRGERDASLSPIEPLSRRGSNAGMAGGANAPQGAGSRRGSHGGGERRVAETGSLRRASFDRGATGIPIGGRVAETGSLVGRSRAGSVNLGLGHGTLPETVVEDDADEVEGMEFYADSEEAPSDSEAVEPMPLIDEAGGVLGPIAPVRIASGGKGLEPEGTPSAKSR